MKIKILLIFIMSCNILNGYAQNVKLNLSIDWKKETIIADTIIPYLKVEYCNNTDEDIYFYKIIHNKKGIPLFYCDDCAMDWDESINYSNINYHVIISDNLDLKSFWEIIPDSLVEKDHELDWINSELFGIYSHLKIPENHKTKEKIKIIKDESFWDYFSDYFIFLKVGECYSDYFNLYGFMKVCGNFFFKITSQKRRDHITIPINEYSIKIKKELPFKINGYKRYIKEIQGDSIYFSF